MTTANRALFLDRDWVINIWAAVWDYITIKEDFIFAPGAKELIKNITALLIPVFVITNQQCIWKWIVSKQQVDILHDYMKSEIQKIWWHIEEIVVCPHIISDNCTCRKPKPWMIHYIFDKYPELEPTKCLFVWDSQSDIEAWIAAWVQTIHIEKDKIIHAHNTVITFFTENN